MSGSARVSFGLVVVCLFACSAEAVTAFFGYDPRNTVPGIVANGIVVDGEGVDWTAAVLKVDLFSGSVYNDPSFNSDSPQEGLWGFVPGLQWDSYVGIPGDAVSGIAGGAGDLGGGPTPNIGGTGTNAVNVSWFNTRTTDTGLVLIGNISLTPDASGTWQFLATFADGSKVELSGGLEGGAMPLTSPPLPPPYPEPGTLGLLGAGGLTFLRMRLVNSYEGK